MPTPPPVLGALDPEAPLPFGPHSVVRAVVAEPVTALLVQRALVMEVAHPKVAAAVAHHSDFQRHPLSRAWVTADAALRLVFGDEHVARAAARQIYAVHDHINGPVDGSLEGPLEGPARAGGTVADDGGAHAYTAHDAALLAWVWATLVDTAETAFTRWVRPFEGTEAEAYYDEMRRFALFLGIPDALLPTGRVAFAAHLEDVMASDLLGTTEQARSMARQVLWFDHRVVPSHLVRVERVLALATLDPRLVDRLGIGPDASDLAWGRRIDGWLRTYYRRVPRPSRIVPALYVVMRRPTIGLGTRARAVLGQIPAIPRR
ncbi:MAG: oxygenase MpaB family protein [Acidimicrobiales bacterium]